MVLFSVHFGGISCSFGIAVVTLSRLRLVKIRIMTRPNSPEIPLKHSKTVSSGRGEEIPPYIGYLANPMWFSVVCTRSMRHHSGQNVWTYKAQPSESITFINYLFIPTCING